MTVTDCSVLSTVAFPAAMFFLMRHVHDRIKPYLRYGFWKGCHMSESLPRAGCPFCHPAIREAVFFKSGGFMAIYNIAPVLPGHVLVVPEAHKTSLMELKEEEILAFFMTARQATLIVLNAFHTDAFDWSVQEKPEAGQSIEHLHLHIVPRRRKDLPEAGDWYPAVHKNDGEVIDSMKRRKLASDDMKIIIGKLRQVAHAAGRETNFT